MCKGDCRTLNSIRLQPDEAADWSISPYSSEWTEIRFQPALMQFYAGFSTLHVYISSVL